MTISLYAFKINKFLKQIRICVRARAHVCVCVFNNIEEFKIDSIYLYEV